MLFERFKEIAITYADRIAYDDCEREYSYRDVLAGAAYYIKQLQQHKKIKAIGTDRIGLVFDNEIDFVCLLFACAYHNISVCVLERKIPTSEVIASCEIGKVSLLISNQELVSFADTAISCVNIKPADLSIDHLGNFESIPKICETNSEFLTQFSSGSTGVPKGIAANQEAILDRALHFSKTIGLTFHDRLLCILTFVHAHGSDVLLWPALLSGATLVAPKGHSFTGRKIANILESKNISIFSALPLYYDLLNETDKPLRQLACRLFISASAPLSLSTYDRFKLNSGKVIHQAYGNTEFGVLTFNDSTQAGDALKVGKIISGIDWKINDTGELMVRAKGAFCRYLLPENEQLQDAAEWFNTRDVVSFDGNYLSIVDRTSNFINVGGNKVSPTEVEEALIKIPSVKQACVFGVPDITSGEQVIAYIIPTEEFASEEKIKEYLSKTISSYKIPKTIVFTDLFPTSNVGKVLRTSLKKAYQSR